MKYGRNSVTLFAALLLLCIFIFPETSNAADPFITTLETITNVTAGTNDQTASTTVTQTNVSGVKASRTLAVGAVPATNETITIGSCVVTFKSIQYGTSDELNCNDNVAQIDLTTTAPGGADNTARTAAAVAVVMRTLTNVSDAAHGAITITGSGTNAVFTTSNTESSATAVSFTDGTTGDITSSASTTGVVPVAQINTITIGGTVEGGDTFTVTLPTVGTVSYTSTSTDTTTTNIAVGLDTAIVASAGYASQGFTASSSSNTVVLTAKVAGTGFIQTSSTTNRSAVAQVVEFTPNNLISGWTLTVTINGTNYSYTQKSADTTQTVVEALQALVDANAAVSCTEDNTKITCTADSAGTAFTYTTSVSAPPAPAVSSSSNTRSGFGSSFIMLKRPSTMSTSEIYATIAALLSQVAEIQKTIGSGAMNTPIFSRNLYFGLTGDDVQALQVWLNTHGYPLAQSGVGSLGEETTYFGTLTQNAVIRYQTAKGITPNVGYFGPITRASINS